jgi:hypothetical protein
MPALQPISLLADPVGEGIKVTDSIEQLGMTVPSHQSKTLIVPTYSCHFIEHGSVVVRTSYCLVCRTGPYTFVF